MSGTVQRRSEFRFDPWWVLAVALIVPCGALGAQTPADGSDDPATSERPAPSDTSASSDETSRSGPADLRFDPAERRTAELTDEEAGELGLLPGRPVVRPTRVDDAPEIDGRLDDGAWLRAAKITDFVQQAPLDGAPATEDTEVWIAYDDDHLYLAFHVHYDDRSIMRASRVDRDQAFADDLMTVYLDTFLDQQRAYDFDINAYNVQGDGVVSSAGGGNRGPPSGAAIPRADRSWDALYESGARVVADGYTAELAIPFKSLRYPQREEGEAHRWGFQIVREIKDKAGENDVWAPISRDQSSFMAQMGLMEGMTGLSTSRNLEILPTFTAIQFGEIDAGHPGGPGFVNQDPDPDAGVNVKYGLTSNLTADFTVNPDFSQIESDQPQIEVNQRFPLFFQELRPFFVEGAEIFNIRSPVTLVHTRTIVDPDYGAKLTGQVGRVSMGALAANDAAPGRVQDPTNPLSGEKAQVYIGRAKVDLDSESHVGAVLTDRELGVGHSRALGLDATFRLDATRTLSFNYQETRNRDQTGSDTRGRLRGIFFQQNARGLDATLFAYDITPDFETDVGFVRRTDQRMLGAMLSYRFWPEHWLINWGPSLNYQRNQDFDGVLQDESIRPGISFSFTNNVSVNGQFSRSMERFGGIDFHKNDWSIRANVNSSRRISFGASFGMGDQVRFTTDPFLGDQVDWSVNTTLRPIPRLTSSLSIDASRFTDPRNGDEEVFDVKIFRAQSTFQLLDPLTVRNITEFNTYDETFDFNLLFTYRVNAGTVFYAGYDDHFRQGDLIRGDRDGDGFNEQLFVDDPTLRRTQRAFFVKLQYLFRL